MDFLGGFQIGVPTGSQNPKIKQIQVFGISHNGIEKLQVQNEAESFYGAFSNIFPWT